ncbi:MAG TPA: hypothetical protein VG737_07790 [Cyclobacteriaceae bacterium]|nr:hypothetical protein [Cyclobacteriaceae bacterium]
MRSLVITLVFAIVFLLAVLGGAKLSLYALPSFTVVITAYMALMTGAVVWIIQRQNDRVLFSQAYLASIVFKILTGLGLILVVIRMDPRGANANAALFVMAYIAFTGCEVWCLLHRIRSQEK